MRASNTQRKLSSAGEIILLVYLVTVIVIAIMRATVGYPTIAQFASSPELIAHGQWWRLFTSAFVIDGPPVPQLLAIGVLGTLGIYMGGSWVFWATAVAGHFLGTLIAYVGFAGIWLNDRAIDARFLVDPDYGVSLIWCAALGVFAALSWFGDRPGWRKPLHPVVVFLTLIAISVVTFYSDDMATVQHLASYLIGFGIMALVDRTKVARTDRRLNKVFARQA